MLVTCKSDRSDCSEISDRSEYTDSSKYSHRSDRSDRSDIGEHIAMATDHSHGEVCSLDPGSRKKVLPGLGLALGDII